MQSISTGDQQPECCCCRPCHRYQARAEHGGNEGDRHAIRESIHCCINSGEERTASVCEAQSRAGAQMPPDF